MDGNIRGGQHSCRDLSWHFIRRNNSSVFIGSLPDPHDSTSEASTPGSDLPAKMWIFIGSSIASGEEQILGLFGKSTCNCCSRFIFYISFVLGKLQSGFSWMLCFVFPFFCVGSSKWGVKKIGRGTFWLADLF